MGIAIDMKLLIECLISILRLEISDTKGIDPEFNLIKSQVIILLLNSKPESLQLQDPIDALKFRI